MVTITTNMAEGYGYPDSFRIRVLTTAALVGPAKAAARYGVSRCVVYKWRKRYTFS